MKRLSAGKTIMALLSAFVFVALATGSAFGMDPVDASHALSLCVEWTEGFTSHLDGIALASAGVAATKEGAEKIMSEVKKLNEGIKERFEKIGKWEKTIKELEAASLGSADEKEKVVKATTEVAELVDQVKGLQDSLTERQDEFETKMQSQIASGGAGQSIRDQIKAALTEAGIKSGFSGKKSIPIEGKAVTNLAGSGGPLLQEEERPGILAPGEQTLTVLDLVPTIPTSQSSIVFRRELAQTGGPDYQGAQGTRKSESDFTFEQASENVETIAHLTKAADQMLDDVEGFSAYLQSRMMYLLRHKASGEVLVGDGAAGHINGIKTQATAYNAANEADVTNPTKLDRLELARVQVMDSLFPPTGYVLAPIDWSLVKLSKNANNSYIFNQPQGLAGPRLWGLPVAESYQQTEGEFTVGSFTPAALHFWVRQQARVLLSTENEADFVENLVTILAEMRGALTVYRPSAFVDGSLDMAVT